MLRPASDREFHFGYRHCYSHEHWCRWRNQISRFNSTDSVSVGVGTDWNLFVLRAPKGHRLTASIGSDDLHARGSYHRGGVSGFLQRYRLGVWRIRRDPGSQLVPCKTMASIRTMTSRVRLTTACTGRPRAGAADAER